MTNQNPKLLPCPFCGLRPEKSSDPETPNSFEHPANECFLSGMMDQISPFYFHEWNTRPAKAEDNKGKGDIDADGLHSKIDMDIEDQLGRDITLEESKIIGLAIRATLSTPAPCVDFEQIKRDVDKELSEWWGSDDLYATNKASVHEAIDHLAASGYLSAPDGKKG